MDTRFWGPSGWRLLHSITFAYNPRTDKSDTRVAFEMLPFVLPCKFCRASLQEYMEKDPLESALESRDTLTRWLWRIHNEVNAKLRSQNTPVDPDPSFKQVVLFYEDLLSTGCTQIEFPGWDFLFSIADLHPMSNLVKKSIPMPGAAPCDTMRSAEEKNKWNCLKPEERLPLYNSFWNHIGLILPFKEWRKSWIQPDLEDLQTRNATMKWLWSARCAMERDLELLNSCKYSHLCKTLQTHRSGCSKSKRAKTCRKTRKR